MEEAKSESENRIECPKCGGHVIRYYMDAAVVHDIDPQTGGILIESKDIVQYDDYHYECANCQDEADVLDYFITDRAKAEDHMHAYGEALDKIYAACAKRVGEDNVHCVFSAFRTDKGIPINDLEDTAVHGAVQFYRDKWVSKVYDNPTWLDAFEAANDYCNAGERGDHIYFESIRFVETRAGVYQYRMSFGS